MHSRLACSVGFGLLVLAGCSEEIEGPSPTLTALDPSLVCVEQITTPVAISGADLSPMAEDALTGDPLLALPTVTLTRRADLDGGAATGPIVVVPDDPRDPGSSRVRWASRASMSFDVFPELALDPGEYEVTVANPNGRTFTLPASLGAVPRPAVTAVEPDILCLAEMDQVVVVRGASLLRVGDALPVVAIGERTYTPDSLSDCADAPGPMEGAELCTEATVTIPRGDLPEGVHDVVVTNPDPAGCASSDPITLVVVPPPHIDTVVPDLVCTEEEDRVVAITGTGFLTIDGELPVVRVGDAELDASMTSDCTPVEGTIRDAESCTHLEVVLPAGMIADGLAGPGTVEVVVVNPPPPNCSSNAVTMALVGPPVVDSLVPDPICVAQGRHAVELVGENMILVEDVWATVTVDGEEAEVVGSDGCTPIDGTTLAALACTSLTISVRDDLAVGPHDVVVTNPDPAGCASVAAVLDVVPPPDVQSVAPALVCSSSAEIVILGTGFSASPSVLIGDTEATVEAATPESITVSVLSLDVGVLDVTVDNGDGCSDTLANALTVTPGPSVYFVDPPVVYNGIATQVTVYISGVAVAPDSLSIQQDGGDPIVLDATFDPARPSRVLAVVPAGLATGTWDVLVEEGGCTAILPDGLTVTDTLTVAVESIAPPFGWTEEDTAVTITATNPAPDGEVQFLATPRAYLNPDVAGPGTVATALGAVDFATATRLTAIVPDGLPAGVYDLIIVNPDGTVGLLDQAFTVAPTEAPPPTVDAVTPASVVNQAGQQVTVLGRAFRGPTVEAICRDDAGVETTVAGVMGATTDTTAEVTLDMSAFANGAICVVRLTNDDGTWSDWSALAVTNPAQNLPATVADEPMVVPRRAPATAAGRVTSQARFVYAIGGDDGTDPGLLASVEAAPVDLFGDLGAWSVLPQSLPEARSFAGAAAIGRFLYVVGGRTAGGATSSVLRAQILDPREAPSVRDVAIEPGEGAGLVEGLYYYRVAAVMAADDASNPGGETLPSDPQAVVVPPLPEGAWLTLWWTPVQNAAEYRVYRTPAPGGRVGDVVLVATVDAADTSWQDQGAVAGVETPLSPGALGEFHEVGPLSTEREGAGVVAAPDPDDPDGFFLYAIGGRDLAGGVSRSYDVAAITVAGDGSQTVEPFVDGGVLLANGRWQVGAVAMDHERAAVVPAGETWLYAMAGADAAVAGVIRDVTAARVGADGLLTDTVEVDDMRSQAGYGFAGANGFLFTFGGQDASPSNTATSAKLCDVGEGGCGGGGSPPEPPDLVNWNNLGFTIVEARYLPGSALESAFLFLIGGQTDLAAATASVERTHW